MNQQVVLFWLNTFSRIVVLILAFFTPLFFWNLTSEFYQIPKLLLLVIATLLLVVVWTVRLLAENRMTYIKTPLDLPLIILGVWAAVSTFMAVSKPVAIFGNWPSVSGGLISLVTYIIFYLVISQTLKKINFTKELLLILTTSGIILSLATLLSYFGIYLPLPFTQFANFTPTGSPFSTTAYLILLLPFLLLGLLESRDDTRQMVAKYTLPIKELTWKTILTLILILFTVTITLTGLVASWVAAALVLGVTLLIAPPQTLKKNLPFLAAVGAVVLVLAALSLVPLAKDQNIFYQKAQSFPREIQLSFPISWKVSVSAFRDSPFWGQGPGSYLFDFALYKPIEYNNSKLWNLRFDSAFNEYLQTLATLGGVGLILLVVISGILVLSAVSTLKQETDLTLRSLSLSILAWIVLLFLHPATLLVWIMGLLLAAAFYTAHKNWSEEVHFGLAALKPTLPTGAQSSEKLQISFEALPEVVLTVVVIAAGAIIFFGGRYVSADYHHRQALNAAARNDGLIAYNQLVEAEKLNPYLDLYRTNLAETNFALANAIAATKGPTPASPAGSLTDQDKLNIQTLLSQAINEARAATNLSPQNPANWEVLGSVYRRISGVAQNALIFSLDSYGRAIQRDPLNPLLRLTVGGVYYSVQNHDMATRFFTDAVNLKPDYANAWYNLAVGLKDKGNLPDAQFAAEKSVSLLDAKSADYQTAAKFLSDLRDQITSQTKTATTPPAASETQSALQNKNLPDVLNLPKLDKIATPPAVKKQGEKKE